MLSQLAEVGVIPGAEHWPNFVRNTSRKFEARFVMLEVTEQSSSSLFFQDMAGSLIPVAVSHGEGRASFRNEQDRKVSQATTPLRYSRNDGTTATELEYPFNPNGSTDSIAGVTSTCGRVLALMPHPERVVRGLTNTWGTIHDGPALGDNSAWMKIFRNARKWCE